MKVMVLGAGTMGAGIAQVVAQAGFEVIIRDIEESFVDRGLKTIGKSLGRGVEKGQLSKEEFEAIMSRITGTTDLSHCEEVDLVIEAIIEKMGPKKEIFKQLDELLPEQSMIVSNTSALSISELATATKRPEKVMGMHFFNPAPIMKLVELIKGVATSEETFQSIKAFTEKLGKTPVAIEEAPGFCVNRILVPMINEAAFILMEGVANAEDIDKAMKLGANHPIGPLALADLIGVDVCLFIMETLYTEFGDAKYRPCPLMRKLVRAGHLGRKTGQGFYKY